MNDTKRESQQPSFEPLLAYHPLNIPEMQSRAARFYEQMKGRRTVRDFSDRPLPDGVLRNAIMAAGTAPSGANQQPWHFAIVQDPNIKRAIRKAAEEEEREFYSSRAPQAWLDALAPLGTNDQKPFLETAPALIVIFSKAYERGPDGEKIKHYYVSESVGIATGILITALHRSGLATLTHTPSPMAFLNQILGRPPQERPFVLLVVGYPAEQARVPRITKKPFEAITSIH